MVLDCLCLQATSAVEEPYHNCGATCMSGGPCRHMSGTSQMSVGG